MTIQIKNIIVKRLYHNINHLATLLHERYFSTTEHFCTSVTLARQNTFAQVEIKKNNFLLAFFF